MTLRRDRAGSRRRDDVPATTSGARTRSARGTTVTVQTVSGRVRDGRWIAGAVIAALVATGVLVGAGSSAAAPARTCEQFGSFPLAGATYVVQNNRWGASTEQCITAAASGVGFTVDTARHTNNAGPAAYPSIYRGCVYGYCTVRSPFPRKVSDLGNLRSSWATSRPTGGGTQQYNTAYDIWFDPSATQAGRNTGAEMMIWLNRTGPGCS